MKAHVPDPHGPYNRSVAGTVWRSSARKVLRTISRPLHPQLGSIMGVRTNLPIAALTFDDGPDEYHTLRILEVLARHGATATFFLLAERAARLPKIVAAIRAGGHEVALHGYDHSPLVGCSTGTKIRRIRRGKDRLQSMLEEPVRFFRPPYGWQDVRAFMVARMLGLQVVGWTVAGGDWLDLTPMQVADRAAAGLQKGAIVLLHDRAEPSPNGPQQRPAAELDRAGAVEELFLRAEARDLQLVSLGEVLERGHAVRRPWFWRPVTSDPEPHLAAP